MTIKQVIGASALLSVLLCPFQNNLAGSAGEPATPPASVLKFTIPEHDLYPESIAYDTVTGCYFLGSMSTSRILRIHEDGYYEDFLAASDTGLLSSIGMKADVARRYLWVCSGRFSLYADYESAPARTGVFQFDLDDGTLIRQWTMEQESDYHIFNDLALAENGDVYATTTLIGRIYRLSPGLDEMELVHQLPSGSNNNGITLDPQEEFLFFTVDRSISRLELATGKVSELATTANEALGTDGLYFYNDALVTVMPRFKRVSVLTLNEDATAVAGARILVENHPDFAYPTTGVLVGDKLVFVATSFANVMRRADVVEQHPEVRIHEVDCASGGE